MVKQIKYTYRGMNQDVTKSKHPFEFYYKANNIRILSTDSQSTGSVTNELGNSLQVEIPDIVIDTSLNKILYGTASLLYKEVNGISEIENGELPLISTNQKIIGYSLTRDSIILFSTDDSGFDCIWEVEELLEDSYNLKLLYCRNMNFSSKNPIQSLFNYENEKIQKIYWVDGKNQLRYLNIKHSISNGNKENLIDLNSNAINVVGNFDLSQPIINEIARGGNHTSGMIQYAYNLYRLNGSQTKISPLSELIPLDKGGNLGGGEVNEVIGSIPIVNISNIDLEYTHIKLYAIKYTSYNQIPSVSLIVNERISNNGEFSYYDDGSIINEISLEEFLFLGSDPIIPKHIESKDNILFSANIEELNFDINLDCRAYSHKVGGGGIVYSNVRLNDLGTQAVGDPYTFTPSNYDSIPLTEDAVNLNYNTYKYKADGVTLGGEGKYISYTLTQSSISNIENYKFFKDDEIYRIGIQFYNRLGQKSLVKWIADFKAPSGNLQGNYNTLKVDFKPEFYTWLNTSSNFNNNDEKPVGYKIVRADRTVSDRTILCQGALTQMMEQTTSDVKNYNYWKNEINRRNESENLIKIPIPLSRGFVSNISPLNKTKHLSMMNEESDYPNSATEFDEEEIYSGKSTDWKRQQSWQFTKMFQMNSPEVLFNEGISFGNGLNLSIKGACENTKNDIWYKRIQVVTKQEILIRKFSSVSSFMSDNDIKFLGLFGPSKGDDVMDFTQIHREWADFTPSVNNVSRLIYGKPEVTERGQGTTSYNGNSELKYSNSLQSFLTDRSDDDDEDAITTMNSYGTKCITLMEGNDNLDLTQRKSLEELHSLTGIATSDCILLGEIKIPELNIYLGNIYGGNSYESKSRNTYIEIGTYNDISTNSVSILSPGDTYVNNYKIARIAKTDTEVLDDQALQLSEIISFPVESSINLKNRNDESLFPWDSNFQPRYDEYHEYNRVYSQQPTLVQNISDDELFNEVNNFDTRVIASKTKVPGENIDSWTDFLVNEIQDLDGKYGPINSLVNLNDTLFTLQDQGIARLSINPRVQIQGSDGVSVELGKGGILYDYNYISTKSGTINKWSTISSNSGFYYYDALNKTWNRFTGNGIQGLSDIHGLHSFFNKNINYDSIKNDNPILMQGISTGYNPVNNDVYLTVLQEGKDDFTICFNEMTNSFISFYDYKPSFYINKGFKMLTTDSDNNQLWEHFNGNYNTFYGSTFDSSITLLVNPQERDCVFNNIEYKSEMYLENIDLPKETLTHIKAYNEYQTSKVTPLVLNSNLDRKFRMWRANIPRAQLNDNPTLDRMRGHWIYLELILENNDNYKIILHDMNINYTPYNY